MTVFAPFSTPGRFLKGNIHTHSNRSDGALPPEEVARRYRSAGYDFLSLTDHFLPDFDYPLTDVSSLQDTNFTLLLGAELHAPRTEMSELWHIVAVGLPEGFTPNLPGETGPELAKRAFDAGAFVGIPHPAWYQLSLSDAETIINHSHAVEIYNHGCHLMHDKGDGAYLLDGLADKGHQTLTYACDDAHFKSPDFGGGWINLKAKSRSSENILAALKEGQFYSTQGPEIQNVELVEGGLCVECTPAMGILVAGRGYQHSYHFEQGVSRTIIPMDGLADSPWIRVIIFGMDGKRAWTNPYWL